ncbi:protein of unknown function [Pseudodesulfovibrio profundus]|uniref:Uncharacterized protein n=1 Tax=Pseudodesulfovibrio profundus TaxID=57320 RepID=A0A2C8F8K5_9BACT|nr:protein of unknown function [Pseudodesulfovibrio profundus]
MIGGGGARRVILVGIGVNRMEGRKLIGDHIATIRAVAVMVYRKGAIALRAQKGSTPLTGYPFEQ